jgi:hypothetical protein
MRLRHHDQTQPTDLKKDKLKKTFHLSVRVSLKEQLMQAPRSNIVSKMPAAGFIGVSGPAEFLHVMFAFLQTVIPSLSCISVDNSRRLSEPQYFSGLKEIPRAL